MLIDRRRMVSVAEALMSVVSKVQPGCVQTKVMGAMRRICSDFRDVAVGRAVILVGLLVVGAVADSGSSTRREDGAHRVAFRRAERPTGAVPEGADRVHGPDRKPWIVQHGDWVSGDEVVDVQVTAEVALEITFSEAVRAQLREDAADYAAVYVDGQLFGVGSVSFPANVDGFMLNLEPRSAVKLAELLGVSGARAGGPRLSVAPHTSTLKRGGRVTVDIYASGIEGITDYSVMLEVKNGLRGVFLVEEARIDRQREDFIFAGHDDAVLSVSTTTLMFTGSAESARVDPGRSSYLGTVVFRATAVAEGTFTVRIKGEWSSLRDAEGRALRFRSGAATVLVGENLAPRWLK